jgi:hypothetical protein
MVGFRYIIVNALHQGNSKDDNDDDDNNNNNGQGNQLLTAGRHIGAWSYSLHSILTSLLDTGEWST